jgi:cytochrome c biogenesis protein CcdA
MELIPISFLAGIFTILVPYSIPLVPVVFGNSIDENHKSIKRPLIITASLVVSIVLFILLLRSSTAFRTIL